jgi:hypothetical protein
LLKPSTMRLFGSVNDAASPSQSHEQTCDCLLFYPVLRLTGECQKAIG